MKSQYFAFVLECLNYINNQNCRVAFLRTSQENPPSNHFAVCTGSNNVVNRKAKVQLLLMNIIFHVQLCLSIWITNVKTAYLKNKYR